MYSEVVVCPGQRSAERQYERLGLPADSTWLDSLGSPRASQTEQSPTVLQTHEEGATQTEGAGAETGHLEVQTVSGAAGDEVELTSWLPVPVVGPEDESGQTHPDPVKRLHRPTDVSLEEGLLVEPRPQDEEASSMSAADLRPVHRGVAVAAEELSVSPPRTERAVDGGETSPSSSTTDPAEDRRGDGSRSGEGRLLREEQRGQHGDTDPLDDLVRVNGRKITHSTPYRLL